MNMKCVRCGRRLRKKFFSWRFLNPNAEKKGYVKCWCCHDCQKSVAADRSPFQDYRNRDYVLHRMGYASYKKYLQSELWRRIRDRVLKKDGFACRVCGAGASMVHHNLYRERELRGQSLRGMYAICAGCHKKVEFNESRKVGLVEASHHLKAAL